MVTNMRRPKLFTKRIDSLLPVLFEMEVQKSPIFALPFQTKQVIIEDNEEHMPQIVASICSS
jgi:hypothetical protein